MRDWGGLSWGWRAKQLTGGEGGVSRWSYEGLREWLGWDSRGGERMGVARRGGGRGEGGGGGGQGEGRDGLVDQTSS